MSDLAYHLTSISYKLVKTLETHATMIVSDDRGLATTCWSLALRVGCSVSLYSAAAAMQGKVWQKGFQMAVIDLNTPGFDGLAFARCLRETGEQLELPWIIALKRDVSEADVDAAIAAGINDLVDRNGGTEAFIRALESADRVLHEPRVYDPA